MAKVNRGRLTAGAGLEGKVLFIIGMRINRVWQFWKWIPVLVAMPRMLRELRHKPELGLVGVPKTYLSGRVVMVQQYWDSFEQLDHFARSRELTHLPAWRRFNARIRDNGSVGIFHETVLLSDTTVETIYGNMPTFGLGAVTGAVSPQKRGQTAPQRLGIDADDVPPEDPY